MAGILVILGVALVLDLVPVAALAFLLLGERRRKRAHADRIAAASQRPLPSPPSATTLGGERIA